MKYTFLHISDLHYRNNWHEENGLVCKSFFVDIENQIKNYENPYLVFSGDIVYEGGKYELYSDFDSNFTKQLEKVGLGRNKRICVPGNHDVSRDALKTLITIQKGTLNEINSEQLFNDQLPQNTKTFLDLKFNNYKAYETKFAHFNACENNLGGTGWELSSDIGVYCLNSTLCSFAGLSDSAGNYISDQNKLMIDTRSLHKWLSNTNYKIRILVMHHPIDWLVEWAKSELVKVISTSFHLIFSGHIHENSATFSSRGIGKSVHCVAPPLFTKKNENLGYSFVTIDTSNEEVDISYRQWSPTSQKFVKGTSLAGNDSGKIRFNSNILNCLPNVEKPVLGTKKDTLGILQAEFDDALTSYSSIKSLWVDRDLANIPETNSDQTDIIKTTPYELINSFRSCIVRAPNQYGLTCLGRFLALNYFRQNSTGEALILLDTEEVPNHRQGILDFIETRCNQLTIEQASIAGFILDNWHFEKNTRKILRELKSAFPNLPILLLENVDDCAQIANAIEMEDDELVETLYLWALSRSRIRELVSNYLQENNSLDDSLVTKKVIEEIDSLNIHRTPHNCFLILKLVEQAFDESPVNRTEIISRVLSLLFFKFDKIPKYASRPDLKDCEYALGYFCEWLIRSEKYSFTKQDFYRKVQEYCDFQILTLDIEVLFAFLFTEHLFIKKGLDFEFRFNYWLYFFAAHRMYHNPEFAEFIMDNHRYSAYPEIVEFYAGIDRRRTDLVKRLAKDLKKMNEDFLSRTGISPDFNLLKFIKWSPNDNSLETLKKEVDLNMAGSSLPSIVKDAFADQNYNYARPYNQALATFINESSLIQMVQAMKGAARALRNSDHVEPQAKVLLLEEVINCWLRVSQILMTLSPLLAKHREAAFEGMGFVLDKTFDEMTSTQERWEAILSAIVVNVVGWYQDDIFSKKMGALLSYYNHTHPETLGELLVTLVMVKQRPPNWEKEVERFIRQESKNSFYLSQVFLALRCEDKYGFLSEKIRQDIKRLAAISLAKHETGAKLPNKQLIEKATKVLDEKELPSKKKGWQFLKLKKRK